MRLGRLLMQLGVGVRIVTGTHLRRAEPDRVRIKEYNGMADSCRPTPPGVRIGGGVLILVRNTPTPAKLPAFVGFH